MGLNCSFIPRYGQAYTLEPSPAGSADSCSPFVAAEVG